MCTLYVVRETHLKPYSYHIAYNTYELNLGKSNLNQDWDRCACKSETEVSLEMWQCDNCLLSTASPPLTANSLQILRLSLVVEITAYAEKIELIPVAILTGSGTVTPHTFGAVGATDSTVGKAEAPEIPEANDLTNSQFDIDLVA